MTDPVRPPSAAARTAAARRIAELAKPTGALGRIEDVAVWLAGCQDRCPPEPPQNVRAVVFAGDHGVAEYAVSAYPAAVTAAMVRMFHSGGAGVSVLARQHGVRLRVLDIGVDDDLADLPPAVREFKVGRSSGAIHLTDALTAGEVTVALAAGRTVAEQEVEAGADLLISGDMGIGNTTPAAALIAAGLGLPAAELTGRGTGIDDDTLARKIDLIDRALARAAGRFDDPVDLLAALGSADLASSAAFMARAAELGVPVLLDGVVSVAAALVADRLAPGAAQWFVAGHRSTEPAQSLALDKLGLVPLLDLGMRLGEGSGAVAAVPLVRSAALLLRDMALLSDVLG
ncbi:nicotinate-nucleotide--dimethylbenzimidazole phosphoribosyltransferase [Nakamurella sp.]|uniref:nicotinate-nucleotide--dimethylbenzimidazole phosphoribosyltransferase n=1 Tax=Nakamurella sp. TaxID=1869182 RepID=UPI003B3B37FC